ncbi:methyl-accepting chemotaxis protein [Pectinatus frisingensis]|uniref:methyl-accepting chemotaxis protein n=1 Tax=Pectinatus frisingensis TaxID=865 RepID=UPI0018C56246|nr:methyl-accepting chemotaxis protein [Pectinatus frisingensis]
MYWLKNLKVGTKISLLIIVSIIILIIVGGTGCYFLRSANKSLDDMYNNKLTAVQLVNDGRIQNRQIESDIYALLAVKDMARKKQFFEEIGKNAAAFDKDSKAFTALPMSEHEKANYQKITDELAAYRQVRNQVVTLAMNGDETAALNLFMEKGKPLSDKFSNDLLDFSVEIKQSADNMNTRSKQQSTTVTALFIGIILFAIILTVFSGWLIIKQITSRLKDFIHYLTILADGDFSQDISHKSLTDKSEFGDVSRAVDKMKTNVKLLIKNLSEVAEQLAASSEELTANAEESAQASDQIAGTVAKVAAGSEKQLEASDNAANMVEQISTAINQVAANTEIVANSAEDTATAANNGESSIKQTVTQMNTIETKTNATAAVMADLEEKSKQISQIVDVISAISGQTNLLALNAAIESARAGEAGRGFAVVAEEIRRLAEQSQDAAKQITDLINEIQTKTNNAVSYMNDNKAEVSRGTEIVSGAGDSFGKILTMVRNMTSQIHEISAAVEEITSGTQDVVTAVESIDNEVQKTSEHAQTISASAQEQSSSVEEIATASEHLAKMAEKLEQSIHVFKV